MFLFCPTALFPDLSHFSVQTVACWAVVLFTHIFICTHNSGEENVLGRDTPLLEFKSNHSTSYHYPMPFICFSQRHCIDDRHFCCWSPECYQKAFKPSFYRRFWHTADNKIWILAEIDQLELRLYITAHTPAGVHRGCKAIEAALTTQFCCKIPLTMFDFLFKPTFNVSLYNKERVHSTALRSISVWKKT